LGLTFESLILETHKAWFLKKLKGAHLDATLIHIEKMVKIFKMRRCAMDFDTNFCKEVFIKEKEK
jgi:hypothetical protein